MDVNQLIIAGVPGPDLPDEDADLIRDAQPAGFLLNGTSLGDIAQARRLTDRLRDLCDLEPLILLRSTPDGVWPGTLLDSKPPTAEALRDRGDPKLIMTAGWIAGRLLRLIGVNVHLAPNLASGEWGGDEQKVIDHAGIFNRFQRKQGVFGAGLPFPGGKSCADLDVATLLRSPLLPFTALMPELDLVVVDDTVFPEIDPETVSQPQGMNITLVTTADTDDEGRVLLKALGMPFKSLDS